MLQMDVLLGQFCLVCQVRAFELQGKGILAAPTTAPHAGLAPRPMPTARPGAPQTQTVRSGQAAAQAGGPGPCSDTSSASSSDCDGAPDAPSSCPSRAALHQSQLAAAPSSSQREVSHRQKRQRVAGGKPADDGHTHMLGDIQTAKKRRLLWELLERMEAEEDARVQVPRHDAPVSSGSMGSPDFGPTAGALVLCPPVAALPRDRGAEAAATAVRPVLTPAHPVALQRRMLQKLGAQACAVLLRDEGQLTSAARELVTQRYEQLVEEAAMD